MVKPAALVFLSLWHCGQCQLYQTESATIASSVGAYADQLILSDVGGMQANETETASIAQGAILAVAGGSGYAFGALITSWSGRALSTGTIDARREFQLKAVAWLIMCVGGLSVTFAYQSGASVPLLNSFVYATNLVLNMVFQITFKLSAFTKNMRCGTILFGLSAIQLSQIAPPPYDIDIKWLLDFRSMVWNGIFVLMWITSAILIMRMRHLGKNHTGKIVAWAVHIACWGAFTDNWAKVNGCLADEKRCNEPTLYLISFVGLYLPVSGLLMLLSVIAMASTNVALYVPTNLCCQLTFNMISSMVIWREAEIAFAGQVGLLVAYLTGFVICMMAVYIATEDADLSASFAAFRETRSRQLSTGKAVTPFGESLVSLASYWSNSSIAQDAAPDNATQEAIQQFLSRGSDAKVFAQKDLVELSMRLWKRVHPSYGALGTIVAWMKRTPFFEDYLAADPGFEARIVDPLSPEERKAMDKDLSESAQDDVEMDQKS